MMQTGTRTAVLTVALALLMASAGPADVIGPPTDDAPINMRDPDTNYEFDDRMRIRNRYGHPSHPENWQSDGLVRFDLSSIPPGGALESVTLNAYYFWRFDNDPTGRDLSCFRIASDWDESTVTWNTRPALAAARTSGSIVPQDYGWMSWDVTADVEAFAAGAATNYGWQIVDEVPFGWFDIPTVYLYAKDAGSLEPYLEIAWLETPARPSTWGRIKACFR